MPRGFVATPLRLGPLGEDRSTRAGRVGIVGPAMTAATFAWATLFGAFDLMSDGPESLAWSPTYRDLGVLWLLTLLLAGALSWVEELSPCWAAILATFVCSTVTFAHSLGEHVVRVSLMEGPPPSVPGMAMASLPATALMTAIGGIIWIPPILLSSIRHRTFYQRLKETQGNA